MASIGPKGGLQAALRGAQPGKSRGVSLAPTARHLVPVAGTEPLLLDRLDHFEAFELRVVKVERSVAGPAAPGIAVSRTEGFRLCPALERRAVRPDGVTGIQDVVLPLGATQQMELDEARNLF